MGLPAGRYPPQEMLGVGAHKVSSRAGFCAKTASTSGVILVFYLLRDTERVGGLVGLGCVHMHVKSVLSCHLSPHWGAPSPPRRQEAPSTPAGCRVGLFAARCSAEMANVSLTPLLQLRDLRSPSRATSPVWEQLRSSFIKLPICKTALAREHPSPIAWGFLEHDEELPSLSEPETRVWCKLVC